MNPLPSHTHEQDLDDFVRAFEQARQGDGPVDLADFLPKPDHPIFLKVLRELIRLDLEYGWECGLPHPLDEYQSRFPELFHDRASVQEIAYEEYRLRQQAGDSPSAVEYAQRF